MLYRLYSVLLLVVLSATAQSPYSLRIIDQGKKAEIIKDSVVIRQVEKKENTHPWVGGLISEDGAIVVLENSFGRWAEVVDFRNNEEGRRHSFRPSGDPKLSGITKDTLIISGQKVVSLGSAGFNYGLIVLNLDHPEKGSRLLKEFKRGDRIVSVDDNHAHVHTNGFFKPYVCKVALDK